MQNGLLVLRRYWQRPKKGDCVAYKEIAGFSVGGMGVKSFAALLGQIQFLPMCLLMSVCYGLSVTQIMILFIITNIVNVLKTPIVSMMVDNTNTAVGKFRPYIIWAGIPALIAIIGCTWLVPHPDYIIKVTNELGEVTNTISVEGWMQDLVFNVNGTPWGTIVMIAIFVNLLNLSQPLLNNAYMGISQTITPNSSERSKILGISEFLANLGPSIIQFLLPTLGGIFFGASAMENIWTYRIFMPILGLVGFILGLVVMASTQERVVMPKMQKNKIGFFKGMALLCHSKEFWLVTFSKFFDGFKGTLTMMLIWVCTYQLKNSALLGIAQTVTSLGFTPGIILAPVLIWKMGTRGAGCFAHFLNVGMAGLMLVVFLIPGINTTVLAWLFIIALFFYNFAMGPQYIIQTTIMSDGFDDLQDRKDVRIEGFAQNFQLMIATLGTILSTVIFSYIYESNGLVPDELTGKTDYSVLGTNPEMLKTIITQVIIVILVACFLSAVPYIFVTLNKKKMETIRTSLERKKVVADNGLEDATEEEKDAAYAKFLEEREAEDEKAKALAEREKAELEAKQAKAREKEEAYQQELVDLENRLKAEGKSEDEIKAAINAKKKERAAIKKQLNQEAWAKMKEDQKQLRERKKAFCAEWIENAKAEGQKKYLKVLAQEAFSRLLAEEALAGPSEEELAEAEEAKLKALEAQAEAVETEITEVVEDTPADTVETVEVKEEVVAEEKAEETTDTPVEE